MVFTLHKNSVAFALTVFGNKLTSAVFQFYYVKLFLNHYHISEGWFSAAQVVYLIWNAINDPLFAYWQDNSNIRAFRSRRHAILYGAPLFSICFLLPWFPWGRYETSGWLVGIQLMFSLCAYDTLFTFVLLAHCAMYAEISTKHEDRLRLTKYCQCASILGATSVMGAEFVSSSLENFRAFQMFCLVLAFVSWLAMHYTGRNVVTMYDSVNMTDRDSTSKSDDSAGKSSSGRPTMWVQFKQIVCERNFLSFVTMNFFQLLHITYKANFLAIFGDQLIPPSDLPPLARRMLYGSAFVIPQVLVLVLGPVAGRYGYYRVIMCSFIIKIASGVTMFIVGQTHSWILAVFFLIDLCVPDAMFSFFNLPLSDIIDYDKDKYNRRTPISSSVFGYNALFTKAASSIAPIMILNILNRYDYQALMASHKLDGPDMRNTTQLHHAMFTVACCIPVVIGCIQIVVWYPYSIRNSHVIFPKHIET